MSYFVPARRFARLAWLLPLFALLCNFSSLFMARMIYHIQKRWRNTVKWTMNIRCARCEQHKHDLHHSETAARAFEVVEFHKFSNSIGLFGWQSIVDCLDESDWPTLGIYTVSIRWIFCIFWWIFYGECFAFLSSCFSFHQSPHCTCKLGEMCNTRSLASSSLQESVLISMGIDRTN